MIAFLKRLWAAFNPPSTKEFTRECMCESRQKVFNDAYMQSRRLWEYKDDVLTVYKYDPEDKWLALCLKMKLEQALEQEEYLEAARIRDLINKK